MVGNVHMFPLILGGQLHLVRYDIIWYTVGTVLILARYVQDILYVHIVILVLHDHACYTYVHI